MLGVMILPVALLRVKIIKIIAVKTPTTPANFSAVVIGDSVAAYYHRVCSIFITGHMGEAIKYTNYAAVGCGLLDAVKVTLSKRTE